ncbi:helix-turn-helix domain-containing protein [Methylobacterium sp. J-092]|uniref:AlbA family DNA-binding domain-containing protein n=1 Tax=Methylobacterium sp. J-092 TaxID=2836667 RepID=UPI001FB9EA07|nr:ATP-binding protein [Methylobacterium sp. J-092]MCJ2007058.1 ATP-binding protein [Methylobacterium sp. J-092]
MAITMSPPPSCTAIEDGTLVEGTGLDFKQKVDLESDRGKTKLVDDVVAMLTAGPGYLVFGVAEEKGRFRHFEPIRGDRDAFERRLTSVLLDNIDPRPLRIAMSSFEVDDGFVAILHVPWHGRRAFQNRITGGFLTRTGARNTPLTRDEVRALFVPEERFVGDALALAGREDARCIERGLLQDDGPTFHLAVVPEERYQPGRRPFDRGTGSLRVAPLFHHGGAEVLRPCQDGYEALQVTFMEGRSITRGFVDSDWSLYVQVAHPFSDDHGRVTLHEFGKALPGYMAALADMFREDLDGPFCVAMAVRNLRRNPKVGWVFPTTDGIAVPPVLVDRIDDADYTEGFAAAVVRGSRYG